MTPAPSSPDSTPAASPPNSPALAAAIDAAFASVTDFAASDRLSRDLLNVRASTRRLAQRQRLFDAAALPSTPRAPLP